MLLYMRSASRARTPVSASATTPISTGRTAWCQSNFSSGRMTRLRGFSCGCGGSMTTSGSRVPGSARAFCRSRAMSSACW